MTESHPPIESHHVSPGDPALAIDLGGGLVAHKLSVGSMDNNAYLLVPEHGPSVLIDAAADPERLVDLIDGRPVATLVTTHRHHDHIGALTPLVQTLDAEAVAGTPDSEAIAESTGTRPRGVWSGDDVPVGDSALTVIGLVGHTPGSIALLWQPDGSPAHLFTGDSLFPGGPGRTRSASDFTTLMDDLQATLFDVLDDDTVVHPGHGDSTTIGAERPHLDEWRARGW